MVKLSTARLEKEMCQRRLGVTEAARLCKISSSRMSRILSSPSSWVNVRYATAANVAAVFGLDVDEMLEYRNRPA